MALTRSGVIEAIRAGCDTLQAVAERLSADPARVSNELMKLRALKRIEPREIVKRREGQIGRPPTRWRVNELWQPAPRARSEETRAKISASVRKRWSEPEFRLRQYAGMQAGKELKTAFVPAWVRESHRHVYREIARVLDEETAAQWAREAKRLITFEGERLMDREGA